MRSFIQTAALITACGSAVFWFASAMCRLPSIKPSMNELDKVTELSNRLQRMSTWNFWAGLMGISRMIERDNRADLPLLFANTMKARVTPACDKSVGWISQNTP